MTINTGRLMPVIALACVAAAATLGMLTQSLWPLAMITFAPAALVVAMRPNWLAALVVTLSAACITIPSLSQRLTVDHVIAAVLIVSATMHSLIRREPQPRNAMRTTAAAFLAVMLFTASIRGFGLKALGSDLWGGTPYVQLMVAGCLFLQTWRVQLTQRQWVTSTIALCLLSLLPTIANVLNRYEIANVLSNIVHTQFDDELQALTMLSADRVRFTRIQVANVASTFMFLLALLLHRKGLRTQVMAAFAIAAAIFLTGISGHRVSILYGVTLFAAYGLLNRQVPVFRRVVNPVSVGIVVLLVVLAFSAPHLPLSFQRAMSWVPFVHISPEARIDADSTWGWRLEVWHRALREARQYLWLGKGFAFSARELMTFVSWSMQDMEYVMVSRNYHNGVLSLLIDLGLAGLITGTAFVVVTLRAQWQRLKQSWNSPVLQHLHHVFLASFIAQVIIYLITAGSTATFVVLFLWVFILEGLARTDAALHERAPATDPTGSAMPLRPGMIE